MPNIMDVYNYCLKQKSCTSCELIRDDNFMSCEFKRKPCFWDIDKIKRVLKVNKVNKGK